MHVVVRSYKSDPEQADEAMKLAEKTFLPIIRSIPGFVNFYGFKTRQGFASVSVFCSESGADESTRMAADWVGKELAFVTGPPEIISGDAIMHESAVDEMAVCG